MKKIKVTNVTKRAKSRAGVHLQGGESTETTVNGRDYLVLKAAKSFQVEVLDNEPQQEEKVKQEDTNAPDKEGDLSFKGMNADDTVAYVTDNYVNIDQAIEVEKDEGNRKTVIEKLEDLKGD